MKATGKVSQYEIFKKFELSKTLQKQVVDYAKDCGKVIFTAPSHIDDLKTIDELNVPIIKIGSDLACHIPLLKQIISTGKPMILSTGMCNLEEVRDSVDAISDGQLILMHCVSNYPSDFNELNLKVIPNMKSEFNIPIGFSDHTPGLLSTITSVALGANIIERHFKDLNNTPSPDDIHALTKDEFLELTNSIDFIQDSFGDGIKKPNASEMKNIVSVRKSLVAKKAIKKGVRIAKRVAKDATSPYDPGGYTTIGSLGNPHLGNEEKRKKERAAKKKVSEGTDKAFEYVKKQIAAKYGKSGYVSKDNPRKPQSAADKSKARAHQAKVDKENAAERAKDPSQGRYPKG